MEWQDCYSFGKKAHLNGIHQDNDSILTDNILVDSNAAKHVCFEGKKYKLFDLELRFMTKF